ncbi:MAG: prolyl-tRNA synthetase [Candidatus Taylorbacteria bacterium CG10_big_fil_rev_8_21_14_0_10_41_48]|uniref:Proline--tRNA ligase n=1 Tax=Candidatus Taylorbacteria bacterium CG10_big_fil_rev_8_21_14_0_10_41_48 TaxID=1975024 RepID=A0A2M8LBT2_9BACT|nr:MAG: prolyl-tRNA synthetase [Candidatus Taylorbacteria bacterium CG10_big_fil_rev_8_21_14_0_10_41_48]
MRQSQLFTKTRKEAPKDEVAKNAELLIRAGYIHKEMAGVYSYLPLGLRVMEKIVGIIREEMNAIGGQELALTALQERSVWEKTNRWSDAVVDNWFKTKLKNGTELGLGFTHEESLTALMTEYIHSYRDLPVYAYQFQTKFRNEARAKSGIMRGREFLMKDLYSFSLDQASHEAFYEKAKQAYINVFDRLGLGDRTYVTFATGGSFSKYSHEFQTVTDAGEDMIYVDESKKIAVNKEVLNDEVLNDLGLNRDSLVEKKAVEVGNIFNLGTKFSDALELSYVDEKGGKKPVVMGSYGLGPGRIMGTIVEVLSDDKGIVWPVSVAPFKVHLVLVDGKDGKAKIEADKLYSMLTDHGIEVLYDDRDLRPGEKFTDSDLIGIPFRVVVSDKSIEKGGYELKERATETVSILAEKELMSRLSK